MAEDFPDSELEESFHKCLCEHKGLIKKAKEIGAIEVISYEPKVIITIEKRMPRYLPRETCAV